MRLRMRLGMTVGALVTVGLAAGCEKTIEPSTGERNMRVTVPLTPAHRERLDRQWQECVRFRSVSACERRFPGTRPAGGSVPAVPAEADAENEAPADHPTAEQAPEADQ